MTARVQGHQSAWKNHVPGDGEFCCAPVLGQWILVEFPPAPGFLSPDPAAAPHDAGKPIPAVYIPNTPIPGLVNLVVPILKMEDPNITGAAVTVIDSGLALQAIVASVTSVVFTPGGDWDTLDIVLDLSLAAPDQIGALLFTNECGCCSALALIIPGDPP